MGSRHHISKQLYHHVSKHLDHHVCQQASGPPCMSEITCTTMSASTYLCQHASKHLYHHVSKHLYHHVCQQASGPPCTSDPCYYCVAIYIVHPSSYMVNCSPAPALFLRSGQDSSVQKYNLYFGVVLS